MRNCTGTKEDGNPCKAQAVANTTPPVCRWHSRSPADRAMHAQQSHLGGLAKAALYKLPHTDSLASEDGADAIDLTTVSGVKEAMARSIRALMRLPFDARVASCMQQCAATQQRVIMDSDVEIRLKQVEAEMQKVAR